MFFHRVKLLPCNHYELLLKNIKKTAIIPAVHGSISSWLHYSTISQFCIEKKNIANSTWIALFSLWIKNASISKQFTTQHNNIHSSKTSSSKRINNLFLITVISKRFIKILIGYLPSNSKISPRNNKQKRIYVCTV